MIDVAEFTNLPLNVRLHRCCMMWLNANQIRPYVNGKPCRDYWKVRAYLKKLPDISVRNIAVMLDEYPYSCDIYSLEDRAKKYVDEKNAEAAKTKAATIESREYDIDLDAFLRDA